MNKSELASAVAEKAGVSASAASEVITALQAVLSDSVAKGEKVTVPGFFSLERVERAERFVERENARVRDQCAGKRVLDFAAGSGLVGVAAMKAGAASCLCADIDPFCQAAVAANAASNGVTLDFESRDMLSAPPPEVDVICAGDICYEKPMTEAVLAWLGEARGRGVRVLIGDPGRTYFPRQGLEFLAEYRVPTTRELEDQEIKRSSVWAMP